MVRYWSCYGCGVATTFVWLIVVSVTLPDGNPGNLEPVLYGGQGSGVQIEVCIVPLCTPCLRDKPADAEYLLDRLTRVCDATPSLGVADRRRSLCRAACLPSPS